MATAESVKSKLQGLLDSANDKTGSADTTLTDAVDRLISGYGQSGSGGNALAWSILDRTVESITAGAELTKFGEKALMPAANIHTINAPYVTYLDSECFRQCLALKNVNLGVVTNINARAFYGCTALEQLEIQAGENLTLTSGTPAAFQGCTSLKYVDLDVCKGISLNTFNGCAKLSVVVLRRSGGICTLGAVTAFTGTPFAVGGTGGTVYVPAALVDSYKAATNWVTLYEAGTCNFVAIEGSEYE